MEVEGIRCQLIESMSGLNPFEELTTYNEEADKMLDKMLVSLNRYINSTNEAGYVEDVFIIKMIFSYIPLLFDIYPNVLDIYGENYFAITGYYRDIMFMKISGNKGDIDVREYLEEKLVQLNSVKLFIRNQMRTIPEDQTRKIRNIMNSVNAGLKEVFQIYLEETF